MTQLGTPGWSEAQYKNDCGDPVKNRFMSIYQSQPIFVAIRAIHVSPIIFANPPPDDCMCEEPRVSTFLLSVPVT
jgi:hypothetical protein